MVLCHHGLNIFRYFRIILYVRKMTFEDSELQVIRRNGLRWGVLKCLHGALSQIGFCLPRSIEGKLEVSRSIIETGCSSAKHLNELLDGVEDTLINRLVSLDRSFYWCDVLIKASNGGLTREGVMEVPLMRDTVKRYEFLSYCLPPSIEASQAIEFSTVTGIRDRETSVREHA